MQNDENTLDTQEVQQESDTDTVEGAESGENQSDSQSEAEQDSIEARLARAEAEAAKYRRLFEKNNKPQGNQKAPSQSSPQTNNVDERILLANGMPDELLTELKAVAQVRGVDLFKAQNDPIFVAVKEKFEQAKRQKEASMPASRGSGAVKVQKTVSTPGLSRDEHKKMVLEMLK